MPLVQNLDRSLGERSVIAAQCTFHRARQHVGIDIPRTNLKHAPILGLRRGTYCAEVEIVSKDDVRVAACPAQDFNVGGRASPIVDQ